MAQDAIVMSPEYVNVGRREAQALSAISTGTLCEYSNATIQGVAPATAAVKPKLNLVAVENMATAESIDYIYATEQTVFLQSVPKGCIVNLKALNGTYNPADEVEIAPDGNIQPLAAGEAVGVVAIFGGKEVNQPQGYDFVMVELY